MPRCIRCRECGAHAHPAGGGVAVLQHLQGCPDGPAPAVEAAPSPLQGVILYHVVRDPGGFTPSEARMTATPASPADLPDEYRLRVVRLIRAGAEVKVETEVDGVVRLAFIHVTDPHPYGARVTLGLRVGARPRFLSARRWYGFGSGPEARITVKRRALQELGAIADSLELRAAQEAGA